MIKCNNTHNMEKYANNFYTFYTNYKNGFLTLDEKGIIDFINRIFGLHILNVFSSVNEELYINIYNLTRFLNENKDDIQIFNDKNIINYFKVFASCGDIFSSVNEVIYSNNIQNELITLFNLILDNFNGFPKKQVFLKSLINIAYNNLIDNGSYEFSNISENFSMELGKIILHELANYTHWLEEDFHKKLVYICKNKTGFNALTINEIMKYASKYETSTICKGVCKQGFNYKIEKNTLFRKISNYDINNNIKIIINKFNNNNQDLINSLIDSYNKLTIVIDGMNIFYNNTCKNNFDYNKMSKYIENIHNDNKKDTELLNIIKSRNTISSSENDLQIKYLFIFNEKHTQMINSFISNLDINEEKMEIVYCHKKLNDDILQLYFLLCFDNILLISNDKHSNYTKIVNQEYYYRDLFKNVKENWQITQQ